MSLKLHTAVVNVTAREVDMDSVSSKKTANTTAEEDSDDGSFFRSHVPVPTESSSSEEENEAAPMSSYWDAPPEKSLVGKSVSTVDVTMLETNNHDEHKAKNDNYWDAPIESSLIGKSCSKINMDTLECNHVEANECECYWDDAPLCQSLEGKTISTIDLEAMQKQRSDDIKDKSSCRSENYFDWKVSEVKKTLSNLSLTNLLHGSWRSENKNKKKGDDDELDRTRGASRKSISPSSKKGKNGGGDSTMNRINSYSGPITTKTHKLRDSWRNSFNRFSQNSLTQLDESCTSKGSSSSSKRGRNRFRFKSNNKKDFPLDASNDSQSSRFSVGGNAPMF